MKRIDEHELVNMLDVDLDFRDKAAVTIGRWLERGDGCAVYVQMDFGRANLGHRKFTSYGGESAQLPTDEPPEFLPPIGAELNLGYCLVAVCRRKED